MAEPSHLSDGDLIQFAEEEMPDDAAVNVHAHLRTCVQCQQRLNELKSALTAYDRYHAEVLRQRFDASASQWPSFPSLLADGAKPKKWFSAGSWWLWAEAAVAVCLLLFCWFLYRDTPHRQMRQMLARSAAVPEDPDSRLQLTVGRQSWYRAAVLQGPSTAGERQGELRHVKALFVRAHYNWNDPLSARSFAAWRNHLPEKRDRVTEVRTGDGVKRFYRLRTQTSQGVLRMASLTLRADTFRPVQGDFHFADADDVSMVDAGEMPNTGSSAVPDREVLHTAPKLTERHATPEDELQVFAALNAIGADVGEPVQVSLDPDKRHVVITGIGLAGPEEQKIRGAVRELSNVIWKFDSSPPTAGNRSDTPSTGNAASISEPLRRVLEQRAGGPHQFDSLMTRSLDASNALLQHAHALSALAQQFPPSVESSFGEQSRKLLNRLRRRHAIAIHEANSQLDEALQPLLKLEANPVLPSETLGVSPTSWQIGANQLLSSAQTLESNLSHLLAANYSMSMGQSTLAKLPNEMERITALTRAQAPAQ